MPSAGYGLGNLNRRGSGGGSEGNRIVMAYPVEGALALIVVAVVQCNGMAGPTENDGPATADKPGPDYGDFVHGGFPSWSDDVVAEFVFFEKQSDGLGGLVAPVVKGLLRVMGRVRRDDQAVAQPRRVIAPSAD